MRLTFPAGRYHATPWGRHVNEGVAEWPPSPYRLLRAIYDVWQRKCFDIDLHTVDGILEALASEPPRFYLPGAIASHTRSYLNANSKDPSDKNLVFDPFLVFNRPHECFICWQDVELQAESRHALKRLLMNMNYLGRSESWVEADLWEGSVKGDFVCDTPEASDEAGEVVRVACVRPKSEYSEKKPWMDGLTFSSFNLLKEKASSPPLLKQVSYIRPKSAVLTDAPRFPLRRTPAVGAVIISLDSTVLPMATTTLEIAEQVRTRLMGAHRKLMGNDGAGVSALFSGKTSDGGKRLDHGHVYILPLQSESPDAGKQGRIDRILILSQLTTFTKEELDAIRNVRELWQPDGRPSIRCVLTWQGSADDSLKRTRATEVISATPFVPPRHWRKGRNFEQFLVSEVRRECENHRVGAFPIAVEPLEHVANGRLYPVEFRRNRKNDPVRPGYALRLRFATPVLVPFAIGYGAHFGLGQFQRS